MKIKTEDDINQVLKVLQNQLYTAERFYKLSQAVYAQALRGTRKTPFNTFFHQVYLSLQESTLSYLLRFFYYGQDSISLRYFLNQLYSNKAIPDMIKNRGIIDKSQLKKDIESITKKNARCRGLLRKAFVVRDKYLAHYDLKYASGKRKLPEINFNSVHYLIKKGKLLFFRYGSLFSDQDSLSVGQKHGFHQSFHFEIKELAQIINTYKIQEKIEKMVSRRQDAPKQ